MANKSVQQLHIKSAPTSAPYHTTYNELHSGFATINTVQKKEKTTIASIFNWKKDKIRSSETHALSTSYQPTVYPIQGIQNIQYTPANSNYPINSNKKFMHYNSICKSADNNYLQRFPPTIHATIRYLPNHKQRTNILATNWEPITYSQYSSNGQPITFQHEISYSEQITCNLTHQCVTNSNCVLNNGNQSCESQYKYPINKQNYFLIPENSNLQENSNNKLANCITKQSKKNSIKSSKYHHNLNLEQVIESNSDLSSMNKKSKSTKLAATVNERFLRIFKKSIREPFNTKKSRKSILDCNLTAYDLVEEEELKENFEDFNGKPKIQKSINNLDLSEDEDQFKSNFMQAKAKQKQHFYSPSKNKMNEEKIENCLKDYKDKADIKINKDEEDRWTNNDRYPFAILINGSMKSKFNSCRIAGKGMQFSKRISILEPDLSNTQFLKEEKSEDEDQNRFDRYAHNFELLDKKERIQKLNRIKNLNNSRSSISFDNSIPNLPDPDYDNNEEDSPTLFSKNLSVLTMKVEPERPEIKSTLQNTASLYNLDRPSLNNRSILSSRLLKTKSQQSINTSNHHLISPSSSTYSSFNSSINSNVKSILKKSNLNLLDHNLIQTQTNLIEKEKILEKEASNMNLTNNMLKITKENKTERFSLTKSMCTFQDIDNYQKKLDDYKPKKQVHFMSSFDNELIVEHINNQEEEQIYDDIMTARPKFITNDIEKKNHSEKNIKDTKNKNYQNLLSERNTSPNLNDSLSIRNNRIFSCTGKLNSLKEASCLENQSSRLPESGINNNDLKETDQYLSNCSTWNIFQRTDATGINELQSTALVKQNNVQNKKKIVRNINDLLCEKRSDHLKSNKNVGENNSELYSTQSNQSYQKTNQQTAYPNLVSKFESNQILSGHFNAYLNKRIHDKHNCNESNAHFDNNSLKEDLFNQQMSSSSSSTSAYVSLYATSSISSDCSSPSHYSTSDSNVNSKEFNNQSIDSNDSSKKISGLAILDSLVNLTHEKLLDKTVDESIINESQEKKLQDEKSNKIVIDVSNNNSGDYDSLNQSMRTEHIYEELECGFEREINIIDNVNNNLNSVKKSIFNGASKDEILGYLVDAKERIQELLINNYNEPYFQQKFNLLSTSCQNINSSNRTFSRSQISNLSDVSSESSSNSDILMINSMSNSVGQHLERNDSGVGTETSKPISLDIRMSKSEACLTELIDNHILHFNDPAEDLEEENSNKNRSQRKVNQTTNDSGADEQICADCDEIICAEINKKTGQIYYPLLCSKCHKRRVERKEIISEFVETEFKYGRDLRIIREEFYKPIEIAGLLTKDQMRGVFLNLEELIQVNSKFSEKLQDAIDIATEQGDEDYYTTVDIGKLFMEFSNEMMKSFQTYCIKQASASRLLGQLEKDKEFLRIFLRVSQMENALLRRMNLSAFLMVPVQRVTKYPLLLNRLFKVTPYRADRSKLKEAQLRVEMHLEQINQQTKGTAPNNSKIWRRISNLSNNSTTKRSNLDELSDAKSKKFNNSVRDLFKAFKSRS